MNFEEVVLKAVEILNRINISYFLTGALAVVYYGEPRTTQDIDIVVEIQEKDIATLIKNFSDDFIIHEESIRAALRDRTMFNVLHKDMEFKVDFWILGDDEFSRERFLERSKKNILGTEMYLPSAEDVIISKLEWFKVSDIDKHYFDALGIYRIQKGNLDLDYINKWCKKKSVIKIWEKIQKENK
ncbi:MAG: hypothetical protein OEW70_05960 [candidate division WOR-3 bacterium]|nr:hypothetical protein [candidate division WOR-3 bacterium]